MKMQVNFLLLVLCWNIPYLFADPIVSYEPVIETLTSRTITLSCEVTFDGDTFPVGWALNTGIYIPQGGTMPRFVSWHQGNIHKLNITNVQASDDGHYTCFVESIPRVTGDIHVKVFVKPGRPVISGITNAAIEPVSRRQPVEVIVISHSADQAQIQCTIGPAKPAFPIKWFINGAPLTSGASPSESTTANSLETTSSILTIDQPSEIFNGAQYKCAADLEQVQLDIISTISPIETVFNLSVQVPPGAPKIDGADPDVLKERGDQLKLICTAVGGNPLPTLQWYRNGEPYNHVFTTVEESGVVKSELLIAIEPADNNAVYRCDAFNAAITTPKSASVRFRVRFAPDAVTITGNEEVKVGDSLTLSCTTTISNPQAAINWISRGAVISEGIATSVEGSEEEGYITQTNITITPGRLDHNAEYLCRAHVQQVNDMKSDNVQLNVLYPPDSVEITGFNKSIAVRMDTTRKMTCTSNEGNPRPSLTWYTGTTAIATNVGELQTQGTIRYRELRFTAQPKDNGARFSCTATNSATSSPLRSDYIDIMVYFPPQNVVITANGPLREGVSITLMCNSGSSNPESTITWYKDNTELSNLTDNIRHVRTENGDFNGKSTVSSYTFTPVASENGVTVLCSARNSEIRRSTARGMPLNILYKPKFTGVPTVLQLEEGTNKTNNNFSALSNPPEITYTWFKLDGDTEQEIKFTTKRDITIPQLSATGAVLNLINVDRALTGNYRVKGTNNEGTSNANFKIDVQYGAEIIGSPTQTTDGEGISLHCVIDANPPIVKGHARWTRLDYDMSRGTQTLSGTGTTRTLTLTIPSVMRDDIGTFTCEANNTFGSVSKEYSVDPVPFQPVIDKAPRTSKSAAQTYDDGYIKCKLDAFPAPVITWQKGDDSITLDGVKYNMSSKTEGPIKFSYVLIIKNVGESDYGSYKCTAQNSKGVDTHDIILSGTSKPDPPTDIILLNATDTSVILSWTPGFDGGLKQKYNIRYNSPGGSYMYADAPSIPFTVRGLDPDTEYEFTVQAFNDLGKSNYQPITVKVTTLPATTAKPQTIKPDEPMFIIIMALAVVFGLLLIVTTVLVCIFVRRRKKRMLSDATDSASQSNTEQLYGTSVGSQPQDDARSYSTSYEKGYEDDYAKHYEDDEKDNIKSAPANDNYISAKDVQPWSKTEGGNFGNYGRQTSFRGGSSVDEQYATRLRNATKTMQQPDAKQRPAFVMGRPPAPKPPTARHNYSEYPPHVPERNYSPQIDYNISGEIGHTSFVSNTPTPSLVNGDDQRGALV